ncbi:MAG: hypothetical protein HY954_09130 [Deltaproteobacteria bacterium]|nr:hypothetical protein [Deltaproteobacteria bacterium]
MLNEYTAVLMRRKWLLILPALAGILIGGAISLLLPRYYKSATMILVEQQQIPEKYVTPADITPLEKRLHTISQRILSHENIEKIIVDFNLEQEFMGLPNTSNPLLRPFRMIGLLEMKPSGKEEMIDLLRKRIEVKIEGNQKRGDAFTISYSGTNPDTVTQVTSALSSLFIEENLKIREQRVEGTSEFLKNEMEKAKYDLEIQERSLRGFKEQHIGSLPEQMDANLRTLDRVQLELQSVRSSLKNAEDKKALLEEQTRMAKRINPLREAELEKLKNELKTQLSIYSELYPDVAVTKKRISEVEAELAEASTEPREGTGGKTVNSREMLDLKSNIAALQQSEGELKNQIKGLEARVEFTPANEQRLSDLKRDYDISLQNYKALLEKKLNAGLAENLEKWQKGERFRVVDPPSIPMGPYKPDKPLITLIGLLAGLAIGVGLVYVLEQLNQSFMTPGEVEEIIEQQVMAIIPPFGEDRPAHSAGRLKVIKGRRA